MANENDLGARHAALEEHIREAQARLKMREKYSGGEIGDLLTTLSEELEEIGGEHDQSERQQRYNKVEERLKEARRRIDTDEPET